MEWTAVLACASEICLLLLLLLLMLFICWNFWFIAWNVARVSLVSSSSSSSSSSSHIERNQMKILYKHLPFFSALRCALFWWDEQISAWLFIFAAKIVITYNFDTLGWILKCNQRKIYRFSSSLLPRKKHRKSSGVSVLLTLVRWYSKTWI